MRQLLGISSYLLRSISTPTLVVHGTADRVVSVTHAEAAAQKVTGSEFFPIADGELELIRERVRAFLDASRARMGGSPLNQ